MSKRSRTVIVGALALAGVVAAVNLAFSWAGAYTSNLALWMVLVIEFVGLLLILRATAASGRGYLRQVGAGAMVTVILAALMFPTAYFAVTTVAPDFEDFVLDAQRRQLRTQGYGPDEVDERMQQLQAIPVAVRTAGMTSLATLITCLPMVLVLAFFFRDRSRNRSG